MNRSRLFQLAAATTVGASAILAAVSARADQVNSNAMPQVGKPFVAEAYGCGFKPIASSVETIAYFNEPLDFRIGKFDRGDVLVAVEGHAFLLRGKFIGILANDAKAVEVEQRNIELLTALANASTETLDKACSQAQLEAGIKPTVKPASYKLQ